jgi:hypothetical protein
MVSLAGKEFKLKKAIMSHNLANIIRFIRNYRYYRRSGRNPKMSWHLASMTLP